MLRKMLLMLGALVVAIVLAVFICEINPDVTYTWYAGLWQGLFFIPNFILWVFRDGLFVAAHSTLGYKVCYALMALMSVASLASCFWAPRSVRIERKRETTEKAEEQARIKRESEQEDLPR